MNRSQKLVALVTCLVLAVVLFLTLGPFSADYESMAGGRGYGPINTWNPLRGMRYAAVGGLAAPLVLVGVGLFVFFGKGKE